MTKINRGKDFESQIENAFLNVRGCTVDRLPDQMSGFSGSSNICDYIAYKYPTIFYIECKSCYGNTLSIHSNGEKRHYGDISDKQWTGLLEKSKVDGVVAGYMIWFIEWDKTVFVSADELAKHRAKGNKSLHVNQLCDVPHTLIPGKKMRVKFNYDLTDFVLLNAPWRCN